MQLHDADERGLGKGSGKVQSEGSRFGRPAALPAFVCSWKTEHWGSSHGLPVL